MNDQMAMAQVIQIIVSAFAFLALIIGVSLGMRKRIDFTVSIFLLIFSLTMTCLSIQVMQDGTHYLCSSMLFVSVFTIGLTLGSFTESRL
jgi:hypothetical protein